MLQHPSVTANPALHEALSRTQRQYQRDFHGRFTEGGWDHVMATAEGHHVAAAQHGLGPHDYAGVQVHPDGGYTIKGLG